MQKDLVKLKNDLNTVTSTLYKYPIPIMPMNDVFQILISSKVQYFDIDFPPTDVNDFFFF